MATNITTRQQLIEAERSTRKLAQQKRNERKNAFLSAQKQLLKTTEYIQELDKLSHSLTDSIEDTYNLLNNPTLSNKTHHFDTDINAFLNNDSSNQCNKYEIDGLIAAFENINLGNKFGNESHLLNTIDIPFLLTLHDIPLFVDKIQSCLYSSQIYITDKDCHLLSFDEYCSYLSAREILIEKLLNFIIIYPKTDSSPANIAQYYESVLPFSLYCLIIILYSLSHDNTKETYQLFDDFMVKYKEKIDKNIILSLSYMNDNPLLLIECINKFIHLLSNEQKHLKWTKIFEMFYRNNISTQMSTKNISFMDFITDYAFNSSFCQSFESMAKMVCNSLESNFNLLFEKLTNNANSEIAEIIHNIKGNLLSILSFDNHKINSELLRKYFNNNITPYIHSKATQNMSLFISKLEQYLKNKKDINNDQYLQIGICCEKLEIIIANLSNASQISQSLTDMSNKSISNIKLASLKHWSAVMSVKLFNNVSLRLKNKLLFWSLYESYYIKTIWKSIIIQSEMEELNINIPCQSSDYIHDICFQFIQILLMIISTDNIPNTIIPVLECELRLAISNVLNKIFKDFFTNVENENQELNEYLGLQFYFDISFAMKVLSNNSKESNALWNEILGLISDKYIELVTMEYANKYLENEINNSVHNCLLMYGVRAHTNDNSGDFNTVKGEGGDIFAKPINKIPRIALLPVASYQITQTTLNNSANSNKMNQSPLRMGLLNSTLLRDSNSISDANQGDKIAQFASGAMSHLKNFGSSWFQ